MDLLAILEREWPVLSKAPWSVTGIIVASLVLGWVAGRFMFGERIAGLKENVDTLKTKLQHLEPRRDKGAEQYPLPPPYGISRSSGERLLGQIIAQKGAVTITRHISANEAETIHRQVVAVFREAGWDVESHEVIGSNDTPDCGVIVMVGDTQTDAELDTIHNALRVAGIDYVTELTPNTLRTPHIVFTKRDPHWVPAAKWGF